MRHRAISRRFHRMSKERELLFRNLALSLIEHEMIKTTVQKAKDLRRVVEPLITMAKKDSVSNRRLVFSRIRNKSGVKKLFEQLAARYKTRSGGYLRVLKLGQRQNDGAQMAVVELVDRVLES